MSTQELTSSLEATQRVFSKDKREGKVCSFVFERLSQLKEQFDSVTLGSVAVALGWSEDAEGKRAIANALDYLAFGEVPVLERRFELWPAESDAVLEQPLCELSDQQVKKALEQNVLIVPTTGEAITDFADHISVVYLVTDFAHRLAREEKRK